VRRLLLERIVTGKVDVETRGAMITLVAPLSPRLMRELEGLMKELESWSMELQRHSPEQWNCCTSLLLQGLVEGKEIEAESPCTDGEFKP